MKTQPTQLREHVIASWRSGDVEYSVRAFGADDCPLLVVLGALDAAGHYRSARWVRPNDDREIAAQVCFWETLSSVARQHEAERLLGNNVATFYEFLLSDAAWRGQSQV